METVLNLLLDYIDVISGFILGLGVLAPFLTKFKKAAKETGEALKELGEALEDGELTKEEGLEIWKEIRDVGSIFKNKK